MSAPVCYRREPRDAFERRLVYRHGFPPSLARTFADLLNGRSD